MGTETVWLHPSKYLNIQNSCPYGDICLVSMGKTAYIYRYRMNVLFLNLK